MSTFLSPDSEERPFFRFQAEDVSNYTALLLSRDGETLYVGAREALFALNSSASFLPGGEYQEVRGDAPGAGGAGQRMAVGKADWKTDLLGPGMMQTERGKELGGGMLYPPFLHAH